MPEKMMLQSSRWLDTSKIKYSYSDLIEKDGDEMKKEMGLKRITPMLIILPMLAIFACAQGLDGPRGGHMMGYGYGGGFMWLII